MVAYAELMSRAADAGARTLHSTDGGEVLMVQLLATEALTLRFALADPAASDRELTATSSISVAANPTLGQEMF